VVDQDKREERENAAASYGWSLALLNSDPELKHAFHQAVKQGWAPQRFIAEIQDTKWFQKHSAAWRQSEVEKTTDPATWKAKAQQNRASIADLAAKAGAVLSTKQLDKISHNAQMFGWNQAQVTNTLASYVNYATEGPLKGQYIGDAGRNAAALKETARRNGYQISDKDLGKWNKAIAAGSSTVDDYQAFMRRQAALSFPSFTTELEAGADMMDVANPYINSMANILEINPEQIDLHDPTIRRALASKNEKTGKPEAMAMYDFEDSLRKDARWQYTDNAKKQAASMALNLGRLMGVSA
jgi:hypothetical protein